MEMPPLHPSLAGNALGIDISYWNGNFDASVRPMDFIIQRTSHGTFRDPLFDMLQKQIRPVLVRGAYQYISSGQNWKAQADLHLEMTEGKGYHFHVADMETGGNVMNNAFANQVNAWLNYVKEKTGKRVLLYTNTDTYNVHPMPAAVKNGVADLWVAQWPWRTSLPNAKGPALPRGATDWKLWQFGGDNALVYGRGDGPDWGVKSANVDLNMYNGTIEDMRVWLGLPAIPDPSEYPPPIVAPPPFPGQGVEGMEVEATVLVWSLRIRSQPSTVGEQVGSYAFGERIRLKNMYKAGDELWGLTDRGWVALWFYGEHYTDLCISS